MALKGKKTTSHLLFNLSLFSSQPFFKLQAYLYCCLCYAVAWRSSYTWQPDVPRAMNI